MKNEFLEKYKDPRWQEKRLLVMQRDGFACRVCGDKSTTLHVHHLMYRRGADPWDYPDTMLVTRCETCHEPGTAEAYQLVESMAAAFNGDLTAAWFSFMHTTEEWTALQGITGTLSVTDRHRLGRQLLKAALKFKPSPKRNVTDEF